MARINNNIFIGRNAGKNIGDHHTVFIGTDAGFGISLEKRLLEELVNTPIIKIPFWIEQNKDNLKFCNIKIKGD